LAFFIVFRICEKCFVIYSFFFSKCFRHFL
jgi:hypothetical protein